jgi:CDP-diglyceride synthetase
MKLPSQRAAGAAGAVSGAVLIVSLFLHWYQLDLPSHNLRTGKPINAPTYTAFQGLEHSDVYLAVAAGVAVLFALLLVARVLSSSPAPALLTLLAGLFALALVVYRGSSSPEKLFFRSYVGTTLQYGWFVALAAAAALVLAGLLAYLAGPRLNLELASEEDEETERPPAP